MARKDTEQAATDLLNWMSDIDPMWASYIRIARTELMRSDRQLVGAWLAYTLDSGAHMVVPNRPEFEPDYAPKGLERECEWCAEKYRAEFGGQRFCGTFCAERWQINHGVPMTGIVEEPDTRLREQPLEDEIA